MAKVVEDAFWLRPDWGDEPNLRSGGTAFWMREPALPVIGGTTTDSTRLPDWTVRASPHGGAPTAVGKCDRCNAPRLHVLAYPDWVCISCGKRKAPHDQ